MRPGKILAQGERMVFGDLLRQHRLALGFTQEELAEHANVSARVVSDLERGVTRMPQRGTVQQLADALGLTGNDLVAFRESARRRTNPDTGHESPDGYAEAAGTGRHTSSGDKAMPIGGFLGSIPSGPLVARQRELGQLLDAVSHVEDSQGRVVMLAGEAGAGKTRLAQEVSVAVAKRGFVVAAGSCFESHRTEPYYPFLDVLAMLFGAATPDIRVQINERWTYLARLLPDSGLPFTAATMDGQQEQQWLFRAVTSFIQAMSHRSPVGVFLDDLHWGDTASLSLLQHLAQHTRGDRILLIGTYRDAEVQRPHPLEQILRDLHRSALVEQTSVQRLAKDGTSELMSAVFGSQDITSDFAELIYRQTDGNPFFTKEVLRTLVERGDVFQRDGLWDRRRVEDIVVPESIRSVIGERVSRLSDQTQDVLHDATVLGQIFLFDDLLAMGTRSEREIEQALNEACKALLVRSTGNDAYAFNHALTQQALYTDLSPRQRTRLHAAVGEALEQLPQSSLRRRAAEVAWHHLQANSAGRALPFFILAGDQAEMVFAHNEAEQQYRTALDLARETGDTLWEAEALGKLGLVLRIVARFEEALNALEQAAELRAQARDVEGEARTTLDIAFVHYYRGTLDEGLNRVQTVTERTEEREPTRQRSRALADLYTAAAGLYFWPTARYSESLSAAEHAANLARREQYMRPLGMAETVRGMSLTMVGPLAKARQVLEDATLLCQASADSWWAINTTGNIGRAYLDEGEIAKGLEYLEQCRVLIEQKHDRAETAWIESNIGEALHLSGKWDEARAKYENAAELARGASAIRYLSYALVHLAELCALQGSWEAAEGYIYDALKIARRCTAVPVVRKAQRLLAENDLAGGYADRALERLQPLLDASDNDWPRAFPPPVLAESYLQIGEVAKAENLVLKRVKRFRAHDHRRALALWLPVQGKVLDQQQRWHEAETVITEAASIAHVIPYPYAEGAALQVLGLMQVQRAQPEMARASLMKALDIFERLGAWGHAGRVNTALANEP